MDKYERLTRLGEGGYAVVFKYRHKETGKEVAIKKFIETEDDELIRKVAYREVKMLKLLKHPNLVNLIEAFRRKKRIHLVFEYCDFTVLKLIEENNKGYPYEATRTIIFQLIQGLKFFHERNAIHRDVKPENILITKEGVVKLADFGFARTIEPGENLTDYVATRWYRAPELLVGETNYKQNVDVWAVGCVMAELLRGTPLFPGRSDLDMLYLIKKTFGELIDKHIQTFSHNKYYTGTHIKPVSSLESIKMKFPNLSKEAVTFMERCLDKDPDKRWSSEKLLEHEYFKGFTFELPAAAKHDFENLSNAYQLSSSQTSLFPQLAGSSNSQTGAFAMEATRQKPTIIQTLFSKFEPLPRIAPQNGLSVLGPGKPIVNTNK